MSSIDALSAITASLVETQIAVKVTKMANAQQQAAVALLEDAIATAEQIQETGKGEHVDVRA